MSTTIDSRVVEMRFDNKDFEKNASATLTVLNNLDKSLNGFGAVKSLGNISDAANKADLSILERSVESVKSKFSALEVIAVGALLNIGSKATDTATRLLKSFTVDNIIVGWDRYAQKTSAVQTIMGATANQFADTNVQMKYVETELDRLSWFTDETSFRFNDMVDNIGKFTASGVKLDDATKSMQGIALWSAKSGATAEQASRAMYNLSQAMSMGKLTIQDWRSIENANMATMEFKQTAMDLAKELGVLEDAGNGFMKTMKGTTFSAAKGFRDSLSEGWLNDQVMTATFNKYGEFTNELYKATEDTGILVADMLDYIQDYKDGVLDLGAAAEEEGVSIETLRGHLDNLSDDALDFGRVAFRMGQEAKTFKEAIDYVGEAVSSGWMKTFELIFGNYNDAKKLWTSVADELYEIFVKGGEERNQLLKEWVDLGGRAELFQGIANIWKSIKSIIDAVKKAWNEVFPPTTANTLYNITKAFSNFTSYLIPSKEVLNNITILFKGLFSILKTGVNIIKAVAFAFSPLLKIIGQLALAFGKAITSVGAFFGHGLIGAEDIIRRVVFALAKLINYILTAISKIPFLEIAVAGLNKAFELLVKGVGFVVTKFSELANSNTFVGKIVSSIKDVITVFTKQLPAAFKSGGLKGIFTSLLESVNNFVSKLRSVKIIDDIFTGIGKGASVALGVLKNFALLVVGIFVSIVKKIKSGGIGDALKWLVDQILNIGKGIIEFFKDLDLGAIIGTIKEHISGAGEGFSKFIEKVRAFASGITPAKLAAIGFSLAILALANSFAKASEAFVSIGGLANELKKRIVTPFQSLLPKISPLLQFSIAVIAVAKSLKMLSEVPAEDLKSVVASISTLTVVVGAVVGALSIASNKLGGGSKGLDSLAKTMMAFGASIAALAVGLAILNASGDFTDAAKKISGVVAVMAAFGAVITVMSKFESNKGFSLKPLMMISFASSVAVIMKSVADLSNVPVEGLKERITAMGIIMAALAVLATGLGNIRIGSVVGVLLLKNVLSDLLPSIIFSLSNLRMDEDTLSILAKYEKVLEGLGIVLYLLVHEIGKLAGSVAKMGASLLAIAGSIAILGLVAKSIKEADFSTDDVLKAGAFIGGLLVLFTLITLITKSKEGQEAYKGVTKLAVVIVALTGAVALLSGLAIILGQIEEDVLKNGIKVIGTLMALFAVVIASTRLAKDVKSGLIIAAVIGVVTLVTELIALSFIPWDDISGALLAVVAVMGSLAVVMFAMSRIEFSTSMVGSLLSLALIIISLGHSLSILKDIPWQQLAAEAATMSATIIILAVALKLIGSLNESISADVIVGLSTFVLGLSIALKMLSDIPWQQALGAAASLAILMLSLGGMAKLMSGISVDLKTILALATSVAGIIAIVFALQQLVPVLTAMAGIEWTSLGKAGVALAGLTGAILILSQASIEALAGAAAMILMAGALYLLIPSLQSFENIDWTTLGKAGVTIGVLAIVLGVLGKLAPEAIFAAAAMVLMGAALTLTAISLEILGPALESIAPNVSILPSLAGGLLLLGAAGAVLSIGSPGMLLGSAALLLLGAALNNLSGIPMAAISQNLTSMAGASLLFGAASLVLGAGAPGLLLASVAIAAFSGAVTLASVAVSKGMELMVTICTKAVQVLGTVFSGIAKAILTPLLAIVQPIIAVAKLIGKGVETGVRDGVGFHSPIDWAIDLGKTIYTSIKGGAEGEEGGLLSFFGNFGGKMSEAISGGIGEGKEVMDELMGSMNGLTGMSDMLTDAFGGLSVSGSDLSSVLGSLGGDFDFAGLGAELFNGELTSLSSNMQQTHITGSEAAQSIDALIGYESQGLTATGELANANIGLANSFVDVNGKVDTTSQAYSNLKEAVTNSMSIFDEFSAKQEISGQEMINNMQSHLDHLQGWADNVALLGTRGIDEGLLQKLVDMGPEGAAQVAAFASMTDEELAKATELWAQSLTLPDQVTQQVAETFEKLGSDITAGTEQGISENADAVVDSYDKVVEDTLKQGEMTAETASPSKRTKRLGENIDEGLKQGISGPKAGQIITAIKQLGNKMVQEFNRIAREITQKFASTFSNNVSVMTQAIQRGFEACTTTAQTAATTLVSNVKTAMDNAVTTSNFPKVGDNMASGVAQGLSSSAAIKRVCDAAANLVYQAVAAANAAAEINSPSKLFAREIGMPIAEGMAKGITDGTYMPVNAAESLIDSIRNSMLYMNDVLNGNIDFDPVITPRLDLTYLNQGISAINRSFESKNLSGFVDEATDGEVSAGGGVTFNQYNYSRKDLTRLDLYRNTKNLLSSVRGYENIQGAQYG